MKATIAALITAAVVTPGVAEAAAPGVDKSQAPSFEAEAGKAKTDAKVTDKERVKLAKAKKKQGKKTAKEKQVAPKAS